MVVPSNGPVATPTSPARPTTSVVPSAGPTPVDTISIGCFLAIHAAIDELQHTEAQLREGGRPSGQEEVLLAQVAQEQSIVVGAPVGCFSNEQLAAFDALWSYVTTTPPRQLTKSRIEELMAATGLPLARP